jgi:DNA-directed RNA polymerase specialized sigma24 family protein
MHRQLSIGDQEEHMELPQIVETHHTGYTLFRQAIVDRDAGAWTAICTHYRPLLVHWVNQCRASTWLDQSSLDLADQAFARAWAALTPTCFGKFANLAALLGYLRTCVTAVVIDYARAQTARSRLEQKLHEPAVSTPEQIVLHAADCRELWRLVNQVVVTPQERTVLYECFVLELPPRRILARHSELFGDITAVYSAKRNLLDRLRRCPELRQFDRRVALE